jgi:gamma-butyrobetaine dioxygenase/trimethyllysine dioxygenase
MFRSLIESQDIQSPFYMFNESLSAEDIVQIIESSNFRVIPSKDGAVGTVENRNIEENWDKNGNAFDFHLDGPYYDKPPRYVILYCVRPSERGGETFISDSRAVIDRLYTKYDRNLLDSMNIVYVSSDKKKYRKPLIEGVQLNWFTSMYFEPNLDTISDRNRQNFRRHVSELSADIEKWLTEEIILTHTWKTGDLLLFDNLATLHGRNQVFGDRMLYRIWFDRPDFSMNKTPI